MGIKQKLIAAGLAGLVIVGVVLIRLYGPTPVAMHGTLAQLTNAPDAHVPIQHIPPPPAPLPVDGALYLRFSHEAGFYDAPFHLTLYAPAGAEIFFTLDGSYPGVDSQRFGEPLFLYAPGPGRAPPGHGHWIEDLSRVTLTTVRAVAVRDGVSSEIYTRNFVMGRDVFTRFCEDTLIFAITSDPHGLFDHYEGILVAGIDRERFRQAFFLQHGRWPQHGYGGYDENPASPANFNRRGREAEREAHVEMFDHTGVLHISQRIGIRVRGGFSRAVEPQKSLELFAREEFGDRNNFAFAFFDNEFDAQGNLIDRYRRVRLRNGGSDRYAGFIRDELSQTLFRQAGQSTTQTHRPAAVFLNGEYYGVAWLKSPRTENHLRRVFGGETDGFEIIAGGERRNDSWWGGEARATNDMVDVHRLAVEGFTGAAGEARFAEFAERVDVDALIRYYAMQIYINNLDWPNHNFELWRYFPTDEERADETMHPYLRDGRWRPFVHDVESAWSIWDNYDRRANEDTMHHILTGTGDRWNSSGSSAFLHGFISRDDTRAQLANTFVDLIEGAFSPENVISVLNELERQIYNELSFAVHSQALRPHDPWWPYMGGYTHSRNAIRRFAEQRPNTMANSVYRNLGFQWSNRTNVTLTVNEGGSAMMNSRPVEAGETVATAYFTHTHIAITARPARGYVVDYWLVNGARVYGERITIQVSAAQTVELRFRAG